MVKVRIKLRREKLSIAVGIGMLLTLSYWIAALHFQLPARETLVAWYGEPRGRVAPFGIWFLTLGGPLLIHRGLVKLGLAEEFVTTPGKAISNLQ